MLGSSRRWRTVRSKFIILDDLDFAKLVHIRNGRHLSLYW
jgi:hypothetical protein